MKKIIVLILILAIVSIGCQQTAEKPFEKETEPEPQKVQEVKSQIKFSVGNETKEKLEIMAKQDSESGDLEIEPVEPTMEALATSSGFAEWCKAGEQWNFETQQAGMDASAQWKIQGIMDSGDYAGLCHVISVTQTPLGDTTIDYYFAEDKESGYFEMKLPNGQVVKQEWHG